MDEMDMLDIALDALRKLRRGSCWCEMAIGNPMVREHSEGCIKAQAVIKEADE